MSTIKQVFEEECAHLEVDAKLAKKVAQYQANFITKNEEHIQFFGGKLLGVQVVRFTPSDQDRWFHEILDTDEHVLEERLLALESVNPNFHISSNTMNLSCAWLMHAFWGSKLEKDAKLEAMTNVALIMQYKFITSILFNYFRYPADKGTAEATYARLSMKYLIKNYDSWGAMLRALSERLVAPDGLHHKAIQVALPDVLIIKMLNDVQGRLRDMVKNIYEEFMYVHRHGIKISSQSAVVEFDGEEILRDKTRGLQNYTRYLQSVVPDKGSFIRQELVTIITKLMSSMDPRKFTECLEWLSDNYSHHGQGLIDELLNETLIHSFGYLSANTNLVRNTHDLTGMLSKLRGTYMSSRSSDPALIELREKAEKVARLATDNKNTNVLAALRTGILLYLCLRAYTMHHYSQALAA